MPYTFEFVRSPGAYVITWSVEWTVDDLRSCLADLRADPNFRLGLNRLHDLRTVSIRLNSKQVAAVSQGLEAEDDKHGDRRVAYFVGDDITYGVLRMAVGHGILMRAQQWVMRNADEAKDWVGLPADYVLPADR